MTRYRPGDQPVAIALESGFTGEVGIEGYSRREAPSRLAGAIMSYPPGACTPWKTDPAGQTAVVTRGPGAEFLGAVSDEAYARPADA